MRTEDPFWRVASRPKRDRAGQGRIESRPESRTTQDSEQDGAGQRPETRTPIGESLAGPSGTEQDRAGESRPESRTEQDSEQDRAGQPPELRTPFGKSLAGPSGTEQDRAGQSRTESRTEQDREQALLQHLSSETRILLSPRLGL